MLKITAVKTVPITHIIIIITTTILFAISSGYKNKAARAIHESVITPSTLSINTEVNVSSFFFVPPEA